MKVHEMIREYYPQYYSVETYNANEVVTIHKITDSYGVLSNFAHTPLIVDGKVYDTAERFFQCLKMATPEARDMVYTKKGNPKMTAKHIQKEHPEWIRSDWSQEIVNVMKFCLQTKYEQSPNFREVLLSTQGKFIVEDQTTFPRKTADTWGVKKKGNQFVGSNLLGRLLMELRDEHCRI